MAAGADASLGVGASAALNRYWTAGPGAAKWVGSPKPWTTLYTMLRKYMTDAKAKGLATEYYVRVFGHGPTAKGHHT